MTWDEFGAVEQGSSLHNAFEAPGTASEAFSKIIFRLSGASGIKFRLALPAPYLDERQHLSSQLLTVCFTDAEI